MKCINCGELLDSGSCRCPKCGETIENTRDSTVVPFVDGLRLRCPRCGRGKQRGNRLICGECGIKFEASPWTCDRCGSENLYPTTGCVHCSHISDACLAKRQAAQNPTAQAAASATKHSMKWYYFQIYYNLIFGIIANAWGCLSYLLAAVITDLSTAFPLCFLYAAMLVLLICTQQTLKNRKWAGTKLLAWSRVASSAFTVAPLFATQDDLLAICRDILPHSQAESFWLYYCSIYIFTIAIQLLVYLACEHKYFSKRREFFNS